jgi:tetratricopeptide (TPR) repeat protein
MKPQSHQGRPLVPHTVFLTRADRAGDASLHARLGHAAFLVLRAVDQVAGPAGRPDPAAAWEHVRPAREFSADLDSGGPEFAHLAAILDALETLGSRGHGPLFAALASYARFLTAESALEEVADVLDTLVTAAAGPDPVERVYLGLLVAELRADLGNRDEAVAAVERAGRLAEEIGNLDLVWRCHLTAAQLLRECGDLEAARIRAERVGTAAARSSRQEFVGRAEVELAWQCEERTEFEEALEHAVRAFEAWGLESVGVAALLKIGWLLARLGDPDTAARAFDEVWRRRPAGGPRCSVLLGFLRCAMLRHDRGEFERRLVEIEALIPALSPGLVAEVYYHLALGYHAFGNSRAAADLANKALAVAREGSGDDLAARVKDFLADLGSPLLVSEPPTDHTRRLARKVDRLLRRTLVSG